jgi:AP-1-like factor
MVTFHFTKNIEISLINFRDRLQSCPEVTNGEFDIDLLCTDLQKKAKCSETGAVVGTSDVDKIIKTYKARLEKNKA